MMNNYHYNSYIMLFMIFQEMSENTLLIIYYNNLKSRLLGDGVSSWRSLCRNHIRVGEWGGWWVHFVFASELVN